MASSDIADDALNDLLERAGECLWRVMLARGVDHSIIVAALDAMAGAFETRLEALDAASGAGPTPIQPP